MTGTLYLIPNLLHSPGCEPENPADLIAPAVLHRTASLTHFVAENAKSARAYLNAVRQFAPLALPLQQIAIEELNVRTPAERLPALLAPLLAGKDVGLISEAGVPAVADPGADLVKLAHDNSVPVKPLIGPSSILLALMGSGLNGQSFAFNGYLPQDAGERGRRISFYEQRSLQDRQTQIFIETPYRNVALLEALAGHCRPLTRICLATNLTLPHETIRTARAEAWKRRLKDGEAHALQKQPTVFLLLAE